MKRAATGLAAILALTHALFAQDKPNIVLILADDLGYGTPGCYGGKAARTPNIDRLAADGVRLTDFHSNGAYCSPTRASLLTGRYQQRCEWVPDGELSPVFRDQRKANVKQRWAWGISAKEITLPALLKQQGYRTALIGKWHLGYDARFHPMNYGFDEFRGFVGGNVDYHTHVAGYGLKQTDWWEDRVIRNESGYTTDLLSRHAAEFIIRNKDKPFFLFLAHGAPHEPWQGRDPAATQAPEKTYAEMVEVLDESVGNIVGTLRAQGLEKNTLVIFCSDNGPAPPRGFDPEGVLRGKKGSLLEGGHRVPFIASWPGVIPAGKTSDAMAMTMDLLPTFAKLGGAKAPDGHLLDGIDAMAILKGGKGDQNRVVHWSCADEWAVRQGPWKLMGKGKQAQTLVNLETDIREQDNRLGDLPERVVEMTALHTQWIAGTVDR